MSLDQIRRADVQQAITGWAAQLAPSTVRVIHSHLASILKAAVADGPIDTSPAVGIRMPPRPAHRFYLLTTGQVRQIAERIVPTARTMVVVAAATGWHLLRHYHASLLIAAGLSPAAVAARLGHADVSETLGTYAHLWPSDQDRAVAAVEAELGGGFWGP